MGKRRLVCVRLSEEDLARLELLAEREIPPITRSEIIRRTLFCGIMAFENEWMLGGWRRLEEIQQKVQARAAVRRSVPVPPDRRVPQGAPHV